MKDDKKVLKYPRQRYAKSKGHIQFCAGFEYILYMDREVLKADIENTIDLDTGIRTGARFECTRRVAKTHPILKYNKKFQRQLEADMEGKRD